MIFHRRTLGRKPIATWDDFEGPRPKTSRRFPVRKLSLIALAAIVIYSGVVFALIRSTSENFDHAPRFPPPRPNSTNGFAAVAGEYYLGDGKGLNWILDILPDGRYSFIWSGCCGVYYRESGSVSRVNGHLVLWPLKPIEPQMERVFLPIKWGRRTYLIPPSKLQEFCDAMIEGDEPRNAGRGQFYLIGEDNPVSGTPKLPERWAAYLKKKLLIGSIVEVKKSGRARVDLGTTEGIRVGTILKVQGRGRFGSRDLKVVSANASSCEVEENYPDESEKPLEVGSKVVTERETKPIP